MMQIGRASCRESRQLTLSKDLAHKLGNLLLLGKIGVLHNRRNASSRLLLLISKHLILCIYFFFQAEDGIRGTSVTGVQTCALPISPAVFERDRPIPLGSAGFPAHRLRARG